tara:strand:+ start:481 stop:1026 length:546 start_codon:yes stop_codon:yes gene_type:complete
MKLKTLLERKLRVFDFDDTIASTNSKIRMTAADGKTKNLTPAQYALYFPNRKEGDKFDYSDFKKLIEPKAIPQVVRLMKRMLKASGDRYVMVLTARGNYKPVKEFLRTLGINVKVIALGSGDPWDKRFWIERQIERNKFDDIEFFDDSRKNIKAVELVKDKYPGIKLRTHHVKYSPGYRGK